METTLAAFPAAAYKEFIDCVAGSNIAEIHRRYAVQIIFDDTLSDKDSGSITLSPKTGKWVIRVKERGLDIELVDFMRGMVRLILLVNRERLRAGNTMPQAETMRRVAEHFVAANRSLVYDLYLDTNRSYG